MKMIRILFMFALVFAVGTSYGQIKVITSGDVGVGTDAPLGKLESAGTSQLEFALNGLAGNPDFTMQVVGISKAQFKYNLGQQGLQLTVDDANAGSGGIGGQHFFIDGTNQNVGIKTNSPAADLHVNGTIMNAGGVVSSDRRLKTNIEDYKLGLDAVMQLKTYSYNYNGKAGIQSTDRLQVGVMAQDVQRIAPELVGEYTYVKYDETDAENSVKLGEEQYLYVNSSAIPFVLINAIQEQQAKIKELEARLAKLEK